MKDKAWERANKSPNPPIRRPSSGHASARVLFFLPHHPLILSRFLSRQAGNKLQNLSEKELQVVEKLSQGIVNKMLHGPMSALRQPDGPDEKKQTLKILKEMFKLELEKL